jgi:hypothetical protein
MPWKRQRDYRRYQGKQGETPDAPFLAPLQSSTRLSHCLTQPREQRQKTLEIMVPWGTRKSRGRAEMDGEQSQEQNGNSQADWWYTK